MQSLVPLRLYHSLLSYTMIRAFTISLFAVLLVWGEALAPPAQAQSVSLSKEEMIAYTQEWEGERYPSGRPKVPADILERMENVAIEQAWGTLREAGYESQFEGDWKMIHENEPVIGRALTANYFPARPDLQERMLKEGHANGRVGAMNSWPIDALQEGDVYVADGYGKLQWGTLIGDNLGTAIYANSGNGVVFNGSIRDLGGLSEIEGFNAFVRGWNPTYIQNMMLLGLNTPIRIGGAAVMPGDVVLAKREGVIFIPAHLARQVVEEAELVSLRDQFGHQRLQEGEYTPGQIDTEWTEEIKQDFYGWLKTNMDELSVPEERVKEIIASEPL